MPGYYDLYNLDGLEVGEDIPEGLQELETFMVDDADDDYGDWTSNVAQDVVEEPGADMPLLPGSDEVYVEHNADDEIEVRETSWEEDTDHGKFLGYIKDKITKVPRHSGKTVPGCERALSYLKSCEHEISKAMRSDLKGMINEEEIDKLRKDLANMMDRLENHIEHLQKTAGNFSVNLIADEDLNDNGLRKTATAAKLNVYMTPFERACLATLINSVVSGGKNIEDTYDHLKNKYKFTDREELAIQQLIIDSGFPMLKDRGRLNDPTAPGSGDHIELQTNYHA